MRDRFTNAAEDHMSSSATTEFESIVQLKGWVRAGAGAIGLAVSALAVTYSLTDHLSVVAAPDCTDAPPGCVVKVTTEPSAVLLVVLVLVACYFLLTGVTGRLYTLSLPGGGGITVQTTAAASTVEAVPDDLEPAGQVYAETSASRISSWNELPDDVQLAALRLWTEWFPDGTSVPTTHLVKVSRSEGRGPHPYYLTFDLPDGGSRIMKVTLSGRGYTGPRASESDAD